MIWIVAILRIWEGLSSLFWLRMLQIIVSRRKMAPFQLGIFYSKMLDFKPNLASVHLGFNNDVSTGDHFALSKLWYQMKEFELVSHRWFLLLFSNDTKLWDFNIDEAKTPELLINWKNKLKKKIFWGTYGGEIWCDALWFYQYVIQPPNISMRNLVLHPFFFTACLQTGLTNRQRLTGAFLPFYKLRQMPWHCMGTHAHVPVHGFTLNPNFNANVLKINTPLLVIARTWIETMASGVVCLVVTDGADGSNNKLPSENQNFFVRKSQWKQTNKHQQQWKRKMRVLGKWNNHICVSFDTSFLYDPRLTDPEYKYHFSYESWSAENDILPQGKHVRSWKGV